jgi:hypothetical protein
MVTPRFGRGGPGEGNPGPESLTLAWEVASGPLTCPPVGTWARASMTVVAALAALIWVVLKPTRPHGVVRETPGATPSSFAGQRGILITLPTRGSSRP